MKNWMVNSALCAVAVTAVLACSDDVMKMAGRVMMDAGRRMQRLDASTSDASAQSSTGTQCGTCMVSDPITIKEPVTIKDPVKVITADTDPAQIVSGSVDVTSKWTELDKGPLVLTDLLGSGTTEVQFATANEGKCGSARDLIVTFAQPPQVITGARLMMPQGQALCALSPTVASTVRWSGFRPYQ
jgi:hypothetical protein